MNALSKAFPALVAALFLIGCGGSGGSEPSDVIDTDVTEDLDATDTSDVPADEDLVEDMDADGDLTQMPDRCEPGDCTAPQSCVGGACVDPVDDIMAYADQAESHTWSYARYVQYPILFPESERCCFDYNGDDFTLPDDALGNFVQLLETIPNYTFNPQDVLDQSIQNDELTLLFEFRELPDGDGDAQLSVFQAKNDRDLDGTPDEPFADMSDECAAGTRCGGDGTYTLSPVSFGDYGALVQFNQATVEDGVLLAGPSTFQLTMDLGIFTGGPALLNLNQARLRIPFTVEAKGVHTEDTIRNEGEWDQYFAAGGMLGGVVDFRDLLELADERLRECTCAGIDPKDDVVVWELDDQQGILAASCTSNTGDPMAMCTGTGPGDGPLCTRINTYCGTIGSVGNLLDVDQDEDGINESASIGLRFSLTGAAIDGVFGP